MRFALVDGTAVRDFAVVDGKKPPYTPADPLTWITCGEDVTFDHEYVDGAFTLAPFIERAWVGVRSVRDLALASSDWTQVGDAPLTDSQKADWKTYRQSLRDLPASADDPRNIKWPEIPA